MSARSHLPQFTARRGTLAVVASSPGTLEDGAMARARALASCWPGPVSLVLTSKPTKPVPPEDLPDEIALIAADTPIQRDLDQARDAQARRLAVQSLIEAGRGGSGKVERLYVLADAAMLELLPLLSTGADGPELDVELLGDVLEIDQAQLWPIVDSLIVADAGRAYAFASGQPAIPVRVVPPGFGEEALAGLAELPSLGGVPRLSVVMPVRGGERRAVRAAEAVLEKTPELAEIILVDDASPDETRDVLARLVHRDARIRLLVSDEQRGFAATCNRGLAIARGDVVVLLGADTVVTRGWSTRLVSHLGSHERIGAVAPLMNRAPGSQCVDRIDYDQKSLEGLEAAAARLHRDPRAKASPVTRLSAICLAMSRRSLRLAGGLDPRFFPGGFEDDDYCARLLACRLIPCLASDVFIHHEGATSLAFEAESAREIHERGWRTFKEKWALPIAWTLERGYEIEELRVGPYSRERHFIAPWTATERVVN